MKNSKIEWTHHTFNPWWGCEKVSDACAHCYAEAFAKRTGHAVWGADKPRRFFGDKHWLEPLKWNAVGTSSTSSHERQRVFCASMADVFEDYTGIDMIKLHAERARLFNLITLTPNLDWLLLTKRPENILDMVPEAWLPEFPDNVWAMTTVENQEQANIRIPHLLNVPARVRGLSMEPLLEEVDLSMWLPNQDDEQDTTAFHNFHHPEDSIHWIICGGESGAGHKTRPIHCDWARSLRDQCGSANVPFFFKQWGDWLPHGQGAGYLNGYHERQALYLPSPIGVYRIGKAKAGRLLDGKEYNEIPASPART